MKIFSIEQLEEARKKAIKNAERLLDDASLLIEHARWPSALFLCQITGEELGKYVIILSSIITLRTGGRVNWKKFQKRLTSHHEKQQMISSLEDFLLVEALPPDYFKQLKAQVKTLEKGKQISLYSDYTEGFFHEPSEAISEEMAKDAFKWAKGRLDLLGGMEKRFQKSKITERIDEEAWKEFISEHGLSKLFDRDNPG